MEAHPRGYKPAPPDLLNVDTPRLLGAEHHEMATDFDESAQRQMSLSALPPSLKKHPIRIGPKGPDEPSVGCDIAETARHEKPCHIEKAGRKQRKTSPRQMPWLVRLFRSASPSQSYEGHRAKRPQRQGQLLATDDVPPATALLPFGLRWVLVASHSDPSIIRALPSFDPTTRWKFAQKSVEPSCKIIWGSTDAEEVWICTLPSRSAAA